MYKVNKKNEEGNKQGYWEEVVGSYIYEGSYMNDIKCGYWEIFYKKENDLKGELRGKGNFINGLGNGCWMWYHENGELQAMGEYKEGRWVGCLEEYFENGKIGCRGNWYDGFMFGYVEFYRTDGNISSAGYYLNGDKLSDDNEEGYCYIFDKEKRIE